MKNLIRITTTKQSISDATSGKQALERQATIGVHATKETSPELRDALRTGSVKVTYTTRDNKVGEVVVTHGFVRGNNPLFALLDGRTEGLLSVTKHEEGASAETMSTEML